MQTSIGNFFKPAADKEKAISEEWRRSPFPPTPIHTTPKRPVGRPRKRALTLDASPPPALQPAVEIPKKRAKYRHYSLDEKREALEMAEQHGWRATSATMMVPVGTLHGWRKQLEEKAPRSKKTGRKIGSGRPPANSQEEEDAVLTWVLHQREQNLPVTRQAIADYAKTIVTAEDFKGSMGWVQKFMRRHSLVLRQKTSQAQHLPKDLERRIGVFHTFLKETLVDHEFDQECIINMDETPVFFDVVPGKTVERLGAKDVKIRVTGGEKQRLTVVLAVTASGHVLPPMVIFRGKRLPPGIIIPAGMVVKMQTKAWMTADIMVDWLREVVRPYTMRRPTLLVMDSFAAHTADPVIKAMERLNITKAIIPGGCTSKIQPLDVSINKPFKGHLRTSWTSFMRDSVAGLTADAGPLDRLKPASRNQLLSWIASAWEVIGQNEAMIQRSFEVCGISGSHGVLFNTDHLGVPTGFLEDTDDDDEFLGFSPVEVQEDSDGDPFE